MNGVRPMFIVAIFLLSGAACSSSGVDCSAKLCPNDSNPPDGCTAESTGACSSDYGVYFRCFKSKLQCSSLGTLDTNAAFNANVACRTEFNAWRKCKGLPPF